MSPEESTNARAIPQVPNNRRYDPNLDWDKGVCEYLTKAFGEERLVKITEALCHPSKTTCLRVNTLTTTSQEVVQRLEHDCKIRGTRNGVQGEGSFSSWEHESVPGVVMVGGSGPHQVHYRDTEGRPLKEVLVSRKCGEAVLRGADAFVPGVLACETGINTGDEVAVSMFVETEDAPPTRGTTLGSSHDSASKSRDRSFIGRGQALLSRAAIFRQEQGVAVEMSQRVYRHPSLYELTTQWVEGVFLQHLPSVVAAHVLDPQPGERILDMCASPGGKTTAIAILMRNQGEIIALDRSQSKVQQIESLARQMGLTCVKAFKMDATKCVQESTESDAAAGTITPHANADEVSGGQGAVCGKAEANGLSAGSGPSENGSNAQEKETFVDIVDKSERVSERVRVVVDQDVRTATGKTIGSGVETSGNKVGLEAWESQAEPRWNAPAQASGSEPLQATRVGRQVETESGVSNTDASCSSPSKGVPTSVRSSAPKILTPTESDPHETDRGKGDISQVSGNTVIETQDFTSADTLEPRQGEQGVRPGCNTSRPQNASSIASSLAQGLDLKAAKLEKRARRKEERRLRSTQRTPKAEKLQPESFDRVLLDAPCSALGLRPRLFVGGVTLQSLRQDGVYKRRFLDQAVRLVKPGGVIVYSTCTISPGENEALVRYALDAYSCLRLVPQEPRIGGPGLVGGDDVFDGTGYRAWLREGEQNLVQRFDPDGPLDTIGFFIAKFRKSPCEEMKVVTVESDR